MHIDDLLFQPLNTKLPTFNVIHNHADTAPHVINTSTIIEMPSNPNIPTLYQQISNSTDKLFFILYTPANKLDLQWYSVQADIKSKIHINENYHNEKSTSACSLPITLMMSIRVTNSVYCGRTSVNTRLALTQDRLYMETYSSLQHHTFLTEINISYGQYK